MANYKNSKVRARETATFRFTTYEKRLLSYLADVQGLSQTDLIRVMLSELADQLGIIELPEPPAPRKPGRPKKNRPPMEVESAAEFEEVPLELSERMFGNAHAAPGTLGQVVVQFQEHFKHRGEKMQHELEGTVRFMTGTEKGEALLPLDLRLDKIDSNLLDNVRLRIKDADLRFPQKNLHLTYLRMMFNFAVKEGFLPASIEPTSVFRSFTAKEVADAFPLPIKTI